MNKLPLKNIIRNLRLFVIFGLFLALLLTFTITNNSLLVTPLFAQCQNNDRNQGLISATQGIAGNTIFGNAEQVCITGTQDASYREFKVPSYQDLENQFYTLSRSSAKKGTDSIPVGSLAAPAGWGFTGGAAGNGIYLLTPNVYLSGADGTGTQVIFIRGNLNIMNNINYADTDPASGMVFIVSGNINIAPSVTKINAVLISSGFICTAMDFSTSTCYNGQTDWQQLVINGSLISINKNNLSEPAIKLGRNLELNTQPAEKVNKQPKYLYNLRGGLLTKDLIITSEDQLYPITAVGAPSPSPSSAPPPGVTICSPVPNSISGDDQKIPGCICLSGNPTCN